MGNALCAPRGVEQEPQPPVKQTSLSRRSAGSTASAGRKSSQLSRISSSLKKASSRVLNWHTRVDAHAAAANARHQLEDRLAEAIKAKASAGPGRPKVSFNRLLLRFPTLHEGFAAARTVFARLAGGPDAEMSLEQLRSACAELGYHADDETLQRIFLGTDADGSRTLNAHEFVAVLAILHILKGPEDEEQVPEAVLATWCAAEDAFTCFDSSLDGRLDRQELLRMMHETPTDGVRHAANGRGGDPIQSIASRRFEELDRGHTGSVSFLQFLFCLEMWVEDAEEAEQE